MKLFLIILTVLVLVSGCIQQSLTPDDVLQNKEAFLGKEITVTGKAGTGNVFCTREECKPTEPCCNTCSGRLTLKGFSESIILSGSYQGKKATCTGNNCNLTCYPLEREETYQVTGTLVQKYGKVYLELKDFR